MVRPAFTAAFLLVTSLFATAQQTPKPPSQEELKKRKSQELAQPYLKAAKWNTDYDKALAASKESGKPIFVFFTRSYAACPFCKQAEDGVLSDKGFPKFAEKVVLYCHITTQITDEPNENLFAEKGGGGFPSFMVLGSDGEVVARHAGERAIPDFEKTVLRANFYIESKAKAATGDKSGQIDFAIACLELGSLTADEAKKKIASVGATPTSDQQAHLDGQLLNMEVSAIAKAAGTDRTISGKQFVEFEKAGRIPAGAQEYIVFWDAVLQYATAQKDIPMFEEALGKLREKLGANPNKKKFFDNQDATLKKLKGGK